MPLGLRVVRKVEAIVREEMNRAGAHRAARCRRSSRPSCGRSPGAGTQYGPELLRFKDRHERDFCFGPTHEEVITDIARARGPELPPAAGEPLPDPDQVPRRDPAALRRHARARVHHEGRLLVPRRLRGPASASTASMYDAYSRIFTRLGLSSARSRPTPARSAAPARTSSTCSPIGRGRDRLLPAVRLRRQRRARGGARARGSARRRHASDAEGADAGQDDAARTSPRS